MSRKRTNLYYFVKIITIDGWQKLWLYLLFRCHDICSIVLLTLMGGTLWNCIFLGDWRISDDYSMLSSNIMPNSFLFRNFSQKSFSCPLQRLLKQCTRWLDQHFWHPFSYSTLSFLQLSILGHSPLVVVMNSMLIMIKFYVDSLELILLPRSL